MVGGVASASAVVSRSSVQAAMATADSDGTLDGVLASINLSSYVHRILAEGFESAADLAELEPSEVADLSALVVKGMHKRRFDKAVAALKEA